MNRKNMFTAGLLALYVVSAATILAVYVSAWPQRQGLTSMMSSTNEQQQSSGTNCPSMNGSGMMGSMMDKQSMNSQQCQQYMRSNGGPANCSNDHHEQCEKYMEETIESSP